MSWGPQPLANSQKGSEALIPTTAKKLILSMNWMIMVMVPSQVKHSDDISAPAKVLTVDLCRIQLNYAHIPVPQRLLGHK